MAVRRDRARFQAAEVPHPAAAVARPEQVDAVERGLGLSSEKVAASRGVLQDYGNMSSATVLFVLERLMPDRPGTGIALAFGPGLAMEGLRFGWTEGDAG